jgi:hypothetical protein
MWGEQQLAGDGRHGRQGIDKVGPSGRIGRFENLEIGVSGHAALRGGTLKP